MSTRMTVGKTTNTKNLELHAGRLPYKERMLEWLPSTRQHMEECLMKCLRSVLDREKLKRWQESSLDQRERYNMATLNQEEH